MKILNTNYLKINERLSLLFLFIALSLRPIYKYFEYVLHFPRINITALYIVILLAFIFINIYYSDRNFRKGSFSTFWLLMMVSLIQLCSYPTVVSYANNGSHIYLLIIAYTFYFYFTKFIIYINLLFNHT